MLFIFFFVHIILLSKYSKEYHLRSLNKNSIVYMSIQAGTNAVLSSEYHGGLPSQILVNGNSHDIGKTINNYLNSSEANNITLIWTNSIENCLNMFKGLRNIISIDMSKFDFSKVYNMAYMFYDCSSLKYLNLNNINTSSVTKMSRIFYGCSSIKYLNLYSLNTSKVECLCEMFSGCNSLLYINMINLYDPKNCVYSNIFSDCNPQLKYTLTASKAPNFTNLLSNYSLCLYVNTEYYEEYNDKCFMFCLFGSSNSGIDDNCFYKCNNYYNYSKIECFSNISEGYFINETIHEKIKVVKLVIIKVIQKIYVLNVILNLNIIQL